MGFNSGFGMYSFINSVFPFMFFSIFLIVIIGFIVTAVGGISTWNTNNNTPLLTVPAKVVTKRSHTRHRHNSNTHHASHSTSYYVTFEFESGDRLELHVASTEYGYLVEGDTGKLSFQGTRYKSFERIK